MQNSTPTTRFFLSFIATVFMTVALVVLTPTEANALLRANWICDSICLGVSVSLLLYLLAKRKCDILGAPVFLGILYIIIFFITPIYDIAIGETSIFGVSDLFEYGIKGSILALSGFILFCLTYSVFITQNRNVAQELKPEAQKKVYRLAFTLWGILFLVGMFCTIRTTGFSAAYILSFGMFGEGDAYETSSTLLGFILQLTRGVVPLSLVIFALGKRKAISYAVILVTAFFEIINGFRYMIVIMICAFFYFYFISREKSVKAHHILFLILGISFIVGIVGYNRNSVRAGEGFDSTGFEGEDIEEALLENFRIYKTYYGVIKAVPARTDYLYFDQMVNYTVIMLIPRAIWPEKPLNPGTKAQLIGLGEDAVNSGYAYPNLGEYYYSFGIFGVLFFMALFGWWLAYITNKYRYRSRSLVDTVLYCTVVPMTLQLVIRGYTPSNFYLIIALFLPCWILNHRISTLPSPFYENRSGSSGTATLL